jgi:hypothetical protein
VSLVTIPTDVCPDCGAATLVMSWAEDALLRHGGYGETRRTTATRCGNCGTEISREITSERPSG